MLLILIVGIITWIISYLSFYHYNFGIMWIFNAVWWGLSDAFVNVITISLLSDWFKGQGEPFAIFNLIKNFSAFFFIIFYSFAK